MKEIRNKVMQLICVSDLGEFSVEDNDDHMHVMHGDLKYYAGYTSFWVSDKKSFERLREYVISKLNNKIHTTFLEYEKIITDRISHLQNDRESIIDNIKDTIKSVEEL